MSLKFEFPGTYVAARGCVREGEECSHSLRWKRDERK